jgi:hypothetical protein
VPGWSGVISTIRTPLFIGLFEVFSKKGKTPDQGVCKGSHTKDTVFPVKQETFAPEHVLNELGLASEWSG